MNGQVSPEIITVLPSCSEDLITKGKIKHQQHIHCNNVSYKYAFIFPLSKSANINSQMFTTRVLHIPLLDCHFLANQEVTISLPEKYNNLTNNVCICYITV
jgi:hypothetical protein